MKVLKSVFYATLVAFVFASCKSITSIPVPTGSDVTIDIPAKKDHYQKKRKMPGVRQILKPTLSPG